MIVFFQDGDGVGMDTVSIAPTFTLDKVFTAPGTALNVQIQNSDWTDIQAHYAIYGRA